MTTVRGVQAEPQTTSINVTGPGGAGPESDNELVAAVPGKGIRILGMMVRANGAVNVRLESGISGEPLGLLLMLTNVAALSGRVPLTTEHGYTLPYSDVGWGQTEPGKPLSLEMSGSGGVAIGGLLLMFTTPGASVDGILVYVEV